MTIDTARAAFWGAAGTLVLLLIFVAALGDVEPSDAEAATIAACGLAVLWAAHSWRRLWADERRRDDR